MADLGALTSVGNQGLIDLRQGGLVRDSSVPLNNLLSIFGTPQSRAEDRRKEEDRVTRQKVLEEVLGGPGGQEETEQALSRMSQINPGLSNTVRGALEKNDPAELLELKSGADEGLAQAAELQNKKTFNEKRQFVMQMVSDKLSKGEDPARSLELLNMNEGQLDLAVQKMMIQGRDVSALSGRALSRGAARGGAAPLDMNALRRLGAVDLPLAKALGLEREGFTLKEGETRFGSGGGIIGRGVPKGVDDFTLGEGQIRFDAQGQPIATGVPKTPTATTTLGKARQDLKSGLITSAEFNQIKKAPTAELKSTIGKLIADKQIVVNSFGENSEQANAVSAVIASELKGEERSQTDILGLQKEFTKLSGPFITMSNALGKVEQSSAVPSAAGDIAMVFNFMKILDPGSVVRESEFRVAQDAAGLVGRLGAGVQRLIDGQRMLPAQRQDFVDTARRLYGSQLRKQRALEIEFNDIAETRGMANQRIVVDFIGENIRGSENAQQALLGTEDEGAGKEDIPADRDSDDELFR